jgi:hypothetical protein
LVTFASVELDVMVRVFMLTVVGLYQLYPIPLLLLAGLFIAGAFQTLLETVFCVLASTLVGVPALIALEKRKILSWLVS